MAIRQLMGRSIGAYIRKVPAGPRAEVRRRLRASGIRSGMNGLIRERLADAIFEVENKIESNGDGHPDDPRVLALNAARVRVEADLGWSD